MMSVFKNIRVTLVFIISLSVCVYFVSGASGVYAQDVSEVESINSQGVSLNSTTATPSPAACGDQDQICCENNKVPPNFLLPNTCKNDLVPVVTSRIDGGPLPLDYPQYEVGPYQCDCKKPPEPVSSMVTRLFGATSKQMCNRYFDKDNYSRIVDPGINFNNKRILPDEVVKHLAGEQNACLKCVSALGLYTSIGCVPTEIEPLIKLIVIFGLILAGALALMCIVVAGIKIQLSRGDSSKVSKAQDQAKQCVMGIVVIVFAAFIVNLFGGGIFGFSLLSPVGREFKRDDEQAKKTKEPVLVCSRECIYSEEFGNLTKCYKGACPDDNPYCGRTKVGQSDDLNNGCEYAPQCGEIEEVTCPVKAPIPSPVPTPPTTVTPPPGTITPPPVKPTVQPTNGPVIGGNSLVTEDMLQNIRAYHQELQTNCGTEVTSGERECVDKVSDSISGKNNASIVLKNELASFDPLQCVGYVKGLIALMGDGYYVNWGFTGSAKYMPPGFTVRFDSPPGREMEYQYIKRSDGGQPQPGDLAKYTMGKHGHVGLISEVHGDKFTLLDANYNFKGALSSRLMSTNDPDLDGYYRLTRFKQ